MIAKADFDVLFGEKHPSVDFLEQKPTSQNTGILAGWKLNWVYIFTTGLGHNFSGNTKMILLKAAVLAFLAFYAYSMGQEPGKLNTFGEMVAASFFLFGPWLYLLPVLEAAKRKHEKVTSIAMVNILLGWTLIGWVFAMAWATGKPTAESTMACPFCGEDVKVGAIKCKHCGSDLEVQ